MVAKTLAGLEEVLVTELENIGATEVVKTKRAVSFEGNLKILYNVFLVYIYI